MWIILGNGCYYPVKARGRRPCVLTNDGLLKISDKATAFNDIEDAKKAVERSVGTFRREYGHWNGTPSQLKSTFKIVEII